VQRASRMQCLIIEEGGGVRSGSIRAVFGASCSDVEGEHRRI
jgi:hypothetical protein